MWLALYFVLAAWLVIKYSVLFGVVGWEKAARNTSSFCIVAVTALTLLGGGSCGISSDQIFIFVIGSSVPAWGVPSRFLGVASLAVLCFRLLQGGCVVRALAASAVQVMVYAIYL
jgi:hypothetical protein